MFFPTKLLLFSLLLCLLLLLVLPFKLLVLFSYFWYYLSVMIIVGCHCASTWFVHCSYLVIHPLFYSVKYLYHIAAEVLIVSLRTVNLYCKNYISVKFFNFCIYYLGCLILILIYSFLLTVLYRKNCKKSFVQITEEGIRPKYF